MFETQLSIKDDMWFNVEKHDVEQGYTIRFPNQTILLMAKEDGKKYEFKGPKYLLRRLKPDDSPETVLSKVQAWVNGHGDKVQEELKAKEVLM